MIGVALVVFVGVFAASVRSSIGDTLDRQFVGDLAIVNTDGFSQIPSAIGDEVEGIDGVETVSRQTLVPARLEPQGNEFFAVGIDPATIGEVAALDWAEGGDESLAALAEGGALLDEQFAEDHSLAVGDEVRLTGASGDEMSAPVVGITERSRFIVDDVALDRELLRDRLGSTDDTTIFVNFAAGADQAAVRDQIDTLLSERFPNAEARSQEEFKEDRENEINQLIALIYVLLGLSVLVAFFGVVNTLSLTILERTRELAMLRAIGTSRSQVRRMVRYESIVTALLGAVTGAVIGLGLGVAAVFAIADEGLELAIPPALPIIVLATGIVLGVVAAIGPARRASRVNVIEGLQYE
jgi:putative ABC transport system permease protein